ncbi:hypothetical protein HDE_07436 [Halotydeus destructor]|nr:hypothetical protein HDE_07436 [Halotydeus destructor]
MGRLYLIAIYTLLGIACHGDGLQAGKRKPLVLLVTYFRSGSSFIGDILQQSPTTFYYFEPLRYMTVDERIAEQNKGKAMAVLDAIAHCNYTRLVNSLGWNDFRFVLRSRKFRKNSWTKNESMTLSPELGDRLCRSAKAYVMKITRLPMVYVEDVMDRLHDMEPSVIFSVRDPRGIYNSRKKEKWCHEGCKSLINICEEMRQDLLAFKELEKRWPNRVSMVKFEDIATEPELVTRKLFARVNLKYSEHVNRFLNQHTQLNGHNARQANSTMSTVKDSRKVTLKWMNELTLDELNQAQHPACRTLYRDLGYIDFNK